MGRYRSRSRSCNPRRASRSPPRQKPYDDPQDRYRGGRGSRDRRLSAPSGLLVRNIALDARLGNIMHRGKRFRDVEFQYSQDGSTSDQSQQPHEPQQLDIPQQPNELQSQHEPPTDTSGEDDIIDDIQIQDGQGRVRTKRGPTRTKDVWQLGEGERIIIQCNRMGQPIKRAGSILAGFLGSIARKGQLCPLNYAKWNDMLPSYKVELLQVVQNTFVLPPESHDWVLKSLNRKWKEYKGKLKMDYKRGGMTEEEVAHNCPPNVYPDQWRELVHYWFSERGQAYSDIGRAARASQSVPHTSGSKSFARRRYEFMEEHGREPNKVEFYKMTHTHRDGSFVRKESRELVDRARTIIAERVGESSSGETSRVEGQVFSKLMGPERYGRVRGYGVGVTPTQLSAVSRYTQDARHSSNTADVHRLESQMDEMRQNYQTEMQTMRAQLNNITSLLQSFVRPQVPNTSSMRRDNDDDATDH